MMAQAALDLHAPTMPTNAGTIEQTAAAKWHDAAVELILDVAGKRFEFTSDHVRKREAEIGAPHGPNEWGRAFTAAKRQGLIVETGRYRKSTRPEARGRTVRVWRAA